MGDITLNDIAGVLAFIAGLGGSIVAILAGIKKVLKKLFDEHMKGIGERLDKTDKAIEKIDTDNCKNFLVQELSAAQRGDQLTTEEKIRLTENFQHYTDAGGNSYIKDWHARLKQEGKI